MSSRSGIQNAPIPKSPINKPATWAPARPKRFWTRAPEPALWMEGSDGL